MSTPTHLELSEWLRLKGWAAQALDKFPNHQTVVEAFPSGFLQDAAFALEEALRDRKKKK